MHFQLNNGIKMPVIGLGVLFAKNESEVEKAVLSALETGYRKIDTASAYQNEEGVGKAIRASNIAREDIFLASKVWNTEQGYEQTLKAFEQSINRLHTDYLDLYMIHWPVPSKYKATYRALEEIYSQGLAKAIGVCNFSIAHLKDLLANSNIVPAINQVEMHPHLNQNDLLQYANEHQIQLEAWRPIMMGEVMHISELIEIGHNHEKSPVQIALRWLIQRGVAAIPKSVTDVRIQHNFQVFDFELSGEEMDIINGLNQNKHLGEDLSHIQ